MCWHLVILAIKTLALLTLLYIDPDVQMIQDVYFGEEYLGMVIY